MLLYIFTQVLVFLAQIAAHGTGLYQEHVKAAQVSAFSPAPKNESMQLSDAVVEIYNGEACQFFRSAYSHCLEERKEGGLYKADSYGPLRDCICYSDYAKYQHDCVTAMDFVPSRATAVEYNGGQVNKDSMNTLTGSETFNTMEFARTRYCQVGMESSAGPALYLLDAEHLMSGYDYIRKIQYTPTFPINPATGLLNKAWYKAIGIDPPKSVIQDFTGLYHQLEDIYNTPTCRDVRELWKTCGADKEIGIEPAIAGCLCNSTYSQSLQDCVSRMDTLHPDTKFIDFALSGLFYSRIEPSFTRYCASEQGSSVYGSPRRHFVTVMWETAKAYDFDASFPITPYDGQWSDYWFQSHNLENHKEQKAKLATTSWYYDNKALKQDYVKDRNTTELGDQLQKAHSIEACGRAQDAKTTCISFPLASEDEIAECFCSLSTFREDLRTCITAIEQVLTHTDKSRVADSMENVLDEYCVSNTKDNAEEAKDSKWFYTTAWHLTLRYFDTDYEQFPVWLPHMEWNPLWFKSGLPDSPRLDEKDVTVLTTLPPSSPTTSTSTIKSAIRTNLNFLNRSLLHWLFLVLLLSTNLLPL